MKPNWFASPGMLTVGLAAGFALLATNALSQPRSSPTSTAAAPTSLTLASYSRGGRASPFGEALAAQLTRHLRGVNVQVVGTSGGGENLELLRSGKAQLAFVNAGLAWASMYGTTDTRRVDLRAVAALYPHSMHVVTLHDSGIRTLEDLRNKRVSTSARGSGSEQVALRLLTAHKINGDTDMRRVSLGLAESIQALREGKIDAFMFGAAAPVAEISQLAQNTPIRFVDQSRNIEQLKRLFGPVYQRGVVPAGTYPYQEEAFGAIQVWDLLVVDASMNTDLAHAITRLLFERRSELESIFPNLRAMTLEAQGTASPISMHMGSAAYYAVNSVEPYRREWRIVGLPASQSPLSTSRTTQKANPL